MPVYNVAQFLSACVDSILSQTYSALEVILVNDGSTDGSAAMCDTLPCETREFAWFISQTLV